MLIATTTKTSIAILAASLLAATSAQAQLSKCTPGHLVSALRQVEAQCGKAKVVSGHRAGAVIRGTRRVSQHAFCNGTNGAIDAVFGNKACALSALRKTNYTIITYRWSAHVHIGTDGWGRHARNGKRAVRVAQRQWPRASSQSDDSNWSSEW
jgi:hypothetical protein